MNFADSYYKKNIIARMIGKGQELLTAYCAATNMPLVECSSETFQDRVFVFDKEEDFQGFARPYLEKKMALRGIKFKPEDKMKFFTTLLTISVDEIVFIDKTGRHIIQLSEFIKKQDFSKLPLTKRPIENPQLQLSGLYFAQEASRGVPTEEKQGLKELEEELAANMVKAVYILPVDFLTPEGTPDTAGNPEANRTAAGNPETEPPAEGGKKQVQFRMPLIKDPKGDLVLPIFTDHIEFTKYNRENKLRALAVPFANLEKMLVKEARGYILNPNGFHLNMPRELLKGLAIRFPG